MLSVRERSAERACCVCVCALLLWWLQIQAAVNANLLEGLLSGSIQLPLTQHVHMPQPVSSERANRACLRVQHVRARA